MRIAIDMQGAQTSFSKNRGVGRYTRELTLALINKCKPNDEIFIVLNGGMQKSCTELIELFQNVIPRENIKTWRWYPHIPAAIDRKGIYDDKIIEGEELFYEWYFEQLNADIIWRPNLQEGLLDENVIISAGKISSRSIVCTTLHDVIPLMYREEYLSGGSEKWYLSKIKYAKNSDSILTVSDFSRETILDYLDVKDDKVVSIHNGFDSKRFYPDKKYVNAEKKSKVILYTGGTDKHKNLENLVAAFGMLPKKMQDEYKLVFGGKEPYAEREKIYGWADKHNVKRTSVELTGYISDEDLLKLMQTCAAFIFPSISEGFGLPPLEAMACGAPVIVANAASLPEIIGDKELLFDPYSPKDMAKKLEKLLLDKKFANEKIKYLLKRTEIFSWDMASEKLYSHFKMLIKNQKSKTEKYDTASLCTDLSRAFSKQDYVYKANVARSVSDNILESKHTLYIDCSAVVIEDYVTGIQRVVNAIISNSKEILAANADYDVVPVYSSRDKAVFYKACFNGKKYVCNEDETNGTVVSFRDGDYLLMPDLAPSNIIAKQEELRQLVRRGVKVFTVLHDIIPMHFPKFFSEDFVEEFEMYLRIISELSGVISVSKATMNAFEAWLEENNIHTTVYKDYFHLGADITKANPSKGLPKDYEDVIDKLKENPTLLMVSTIEPRKRQEEILDVVEKMWENRKNVNLCFVGRNGWQMEAFVKRVKRHKELGKKLFWLKGISDEYLDLVYDASAAVVVASLEEGFGLPLIEAALHEKPLILRDIPVFNEIAGKNAYYFNAETPRKLRESLEEWLDLYAKNKIPESKNIEYLSWYESVSILLKKIGLLSE